MNASNTKIMIELKVIFPIFEKVYRTIFNVTFEGYSYNGLSKQLVICTISHRLYHHISIGVKHDNFYEINISIKSIFLNINEIIIIDG
jgi:hypothetical protein